MECSLLDIGLLSLKTKFEIFVMNIIKGVFFQKVSSCLFDHILF